MKTKIIIWSLSLVLVVSFTLNIIVIDRYNLADKVIHLASSTLKNSAIKTALHTNTPIVSYVNGKGRLSPVKEWGAKIPNNLIINSGVYTFSGKNYSLKKEGLYRFIHPNEYNLQRIVYRSDIDTLLSSISWIVSHGNTDGRKSNIELSKKALSSKVFITCGTLAIWAQKILTDLNIETRIVLSMTLDKWNSYDNGHILIEVWREKLNKYVLYDLDNNSYFISKRTQKPLSFLEFIEIVPSDMYEIVYLANDTRLDISSFHSKQGYDYGFFAEFNNQNIRNWYRRVMQVPLIFDKKDGTYFFMDDQHKNRIESYSTNYKYLHAQEFMDRFYP